ncbi:MAG: 3-isopropylmalate dehydratase small subunit [Pseudomonadota bacterium]
MSRPITRVSSATFVLPQTDIDTDQIIPARFLTTTERSGLGRHAFADWRYDDHGELIADAPLNSAAAKTAKILVAGNNFGCGSSREHAPWALLDFGFDAVISSEIADIFRSNALKNGLVAVVVDTDTHRELLANPGLELTVDLVDRALRFADGRKVAFPIDDFARYCLMEGIDQLGYLLKQGEAISRFEAAHE